MATAAGGDHGARHVTDPGNDAAGAAWLAEAAGIVRDLGFSIVTGTDRRNPAATDLVVALRDVPTLRHFDPEAVQFFESAGTRSQARTIDRDTPLPLVERFEWGRVAIADRLGMTNQWLSFGGELRAAALDEATTIVRFRSPAPIQRWSGHSQGLDLLTPEMGAFFGRLMVPVDFEPGAEGRLVGTDPLALYCAFVGETAARHARSSGFAEADRPLVTRVASEARRLRADAPDAWREGEELLRALRLGR
ncbi:MAG: hypothetical protein RL338_1424 [Chloroflexota bacterium]